MGKCDEYFHVVVTQLNKFTMGICISRPPAPCLPPGPGSQFVFLGPGSQFVFTGHGPQFLFTSPGPHFLFTGPNFPNLYLPVLAPDLCLPALVPNLYLLALVYSIITSPQSKFCIYRPCLLNLCLYLRPWPTICITNLGSEFAFTLLLVVVAVVVVIVVVVISLELIIPIFVCRL